MKMNSKVSEEINGIVQELGFMIGVLDKVPDASNMASHFRDLLFIELHQNNRARKTHLNALKREMLVVARETMSPKSWKTFKAILALDELFGEAYLQKVRADGTLRGEEEYRKVLIEVDLLIASQGSKGLTPELEHLVADVNAVVEGSPFHQSTKD
ncbi:hypothetical protein [Herbaspirillum sp.]|uniref:hypothetical protein n=1 Tax=Herbaspirillum sp. TaxID=1890675 RepID=UPI001B0F434C|nr:hypothetical protein [Herbaspirillum sp.]MBO9537694.1 hypothetical protein [Herbaspirillum sp.]